uniref:PH-like domain-containing protein n=1 Tax=Trypanosoma congolense (strain IL3000) TaxID=1068625 RepID=G0UK07_TRYCI|nr:conserved hypothetical protein [Trypanosoma congolense IL3000]
MKSRPPTKNSINMHDIVAQPLGALAGAVSAALLRPVDLDDDEVNSIFDEVSFILLRAEEALAAGEADAFCALFRLLTKGFTHKASFFNKGIELFGFNKALLQSLHDIFRGAVTRRGFPLQSEAVVELLRVIGNLCDGGSIKEECGALFMEGLANTLSDIYRQDLDEANKHFLTQRVVAVAMINLMKGSKNNRHRILSWNFLANSCALSVDAFFQLQCIELLFRVSRSSIAVFRNLQSRLQPSVTEKIPQLVNGPTLMTGMIELLNDINEKRDDVLVFPLERAEVAGVVVDCRTISYFTPNYLVILVTPNNVKEITVPYTLVRSVRLGRDCSVNLRLHEMPLSAAEVVGETSDERTLTLTMTEKQLQLFKESSVRSWMLSIISSNIQSRKNTTEVPGETHAEGDVPAGPSLPSNVKENTGEKRRRADSIQLVEGGQREASFNLKDALKSSRISVDSVVKQMKRIMDPKDELGHHEATAIIFESMGEIQKLVDDARVTTDGYRDNLKVTVEGYIQILDDCLRVSRSKAVSVVDKLNDTLQELKAINTTIHDRMACIEITLRQSLDDSRRDEAAACLSLKSEGEQRIAKLEELLDSGLIQQSSKLSGFSRAFP